ncbi:MAG: CidA/LrgA family protein [Pseudomonas sp.]|nr:CidA/LrgA family protein [Pseudomonas sp.]MBQ0778349.1 CidA/LrgA family protein [Pseudomonas sp.]
MNIGALLWLMALQVLGSIVSFLILPWLPGPIIGMLLLVIGLLLLGRVPDSLERTAAVLLKYLPLLLVVPASGIVLSHQQLTQDALPIAGALVGSLLVAIPVCGRLLQWLVRRQETR